MYTHCKECLYVRLQKSRNLLTGRGNMPQQYFADRIYIYWLNGMLYFFAFFGISFNNYVIIKNVEPLTFLRAIFLWCMLQNSIFYYIVGSVTCLWPLISGCWYVGRSVIISKMLGKFHFSCTFRSTCLLNYGDTDTTFWAK